MKRVLSLLLQRFLAVKSFCRNTNAHLLEAALAKKLEEAGAKLAETGEDWISA
ncbi:hypothetical protein OK016_06830 [Vibrio chagasii]|nr:hypothetical protein [Vibrio chagasii]